MKFKRLLWDMGWVLCGLVAGFFVGVLLHEWIGEWGSSFQVSGSYAYTRPIALVLGWVSMVVLAYRVQRYLRPDSLKEPEIEHTNNYEDLT